ncbi:MAG TPA: VOC family protein [Opitutaceae bacterium]|nr:VOC family protein [Opitutaceae bacterium]
MRRFEGISVLFVAGFGPVVRGAAASRKLYRDVLGIRFTAETGGYLHTEALDGAKTFALWPLAQAALSCFGRRTWPKNVPVPQAWLEFDVEDVEQATATLESRGYRLLVKNRKEPWGQTVSRFLSPEGLLVGLTRTPALRRD